MFYADIKEEKSSRKKIIFSDLKSMLDSINLMYLKNNNLAIFSISGEGIFTQSKTTKFILGENVTANLYIRFMEGEGVVKVLFFSANSLSALELLHAEILFLDVLENELLYLRKKLERLNISTEFIPREFQSLFINLPDYENI